jgi:hypothetical protein
MRIRVPITGKILEKRVVNGVPYVSGDPDDPVRPVDFIDLLPAHLRDFGWQNPVYDFEKGEVELEIVFAKKAVEAVPGDPAMMRPETDQEFEARRIATEAALDDIVRNHRAELEALKARRYMRELRSTGRPVT